MGWIIRHEGGIIERGEVDENDVETVTYEIPAPEDDE